MASTSTWSVDARSENWNGDKRVRQCFQHAEWAQLEAQAEALQTGLKASDSLNLSAVELGCSEENGHGE
jgi:hypothetical protein